MAIPGSPGTRMKIMGLRVGTQVTNLWAIFIAFERRDRAGGPERRNSVSAYQNLEWSEADNKIHVVLGANCVPHLDKSSYQPSPQPPRRSRQSGTPRLVQMTIVPTAQASPRAWSKPVKSGGSSTISPLISAIM